MNFKPRLWRRYARHCTLIQHVCYSTIVLYIVYHYTISIQSDNDRIWTKMQKLRKNSLIHTNELMNLFNFKYLRNSQICSAVEDILSIIVVTSSPVRYEYRKTIRNTWGQKDLDFKIVFVLGDVMDKMTRKLVQLEHEIYGDIVQGNFIDNFRNETYKHIMALKWAMFYCPTAKFIIKTNDDIVVNIDELKNVLKNYIWSKNMNLIACRFNSDLLVKRNKSHLYYVTEEEYNEKYYPPCCSGKCRNKFY